MNDSFIERYVEKGDRDVNIESSISIRLLVKAVVSGDNRDVWFKIDGILTNNRV